MMIGVRKTDFQPAMDDMIKGTAVLDRELQMLPMLHSIFACFFSFEMAAFQLLFIVDTYSNV
jgi:hypothetical protein